MSYITEPSRIVDLHTHLFNAKCMPLAGVIANLFDRDADDFALARWAAKLINLLTQSEDEPPHRFLDTGSVQETEYADRIASIALDKIGLLASGANFVSGSIRADALALQTPARIAEIQSNRIFQTVEQLERALLDMQSEEVEQGQPYWLSKSHGLVESAINANLLNIGERVRRVILAMLMRCEQAKDKLDEISNFAQFCFSMLSSVHTQAETLVQRYGPLKQPLTLVHHMMDMEWAYVVNGASYKQVHPDYDYATEQIPLMSKLGDEFNGAILGFAAFDPRHENWKSLAMEAIERGYVGFKFYPAMGYRPIGETKVFGRNDPVSQVVIAQRVKDFFLWCVTDQSIPVFTHCTPIGFQTRFKEGLNTTPKYWRELLESDPKLRTLRLCFGHAGGGQATREDLDANGKKQTISYHGWTAEPGAWGPGNFAFDVAAMCREFPNVYCELAYITELIERSVEEREIRKAALQRNLGLACEGPGDYKFLNKVSYGSDWNMPSMVDHPRAYLNVFLDIFESNSVLNPATEEFFWGNAFKFMNRIPS